MTNIDYHTGRLLGWLLRLSLFHFFTIHRPERYRKVRDAVSRLREDDKR